MPTGSRAVELGLVEVVALWCGALQGQGDLRGAVQQLCAVLGAEAGALTRVPTDARAGAHTVIHDSRRNNPRLPPLTRSFARSILGAYFATARDGTIWPKSLVDTEIEPALDDFHRRRQLVELVIIPLPRGANTRDFIELHYSNPLSAALHTQLNMLAPTLGASWTTRAKGVFTRQVTDRLHLEAASQPKRYVLSCDNPAKLSRAEYRVCLFLSRGLSPAAVGKELAIRSNTLRTHLRNIYAKTDCHSLSELVFHLLEGSSASAENQSPHRVA